MKKIIALLTAGILLISLTSCGLDKEKKGATLEIDMHNSYVSAPLETKGYLTPLLADEKNIWLESSSNENSEILICNAETRELQKIELHTEIYTPVNASENIVSCIGMVHLPESKIGMIYQKCDYDTSTTNWKPFNFSAFIDIYDDSMQYLKTMNLPSDTNFMSSNLTIDSNQNWIWTESNEANAEIKCYVSDFDMKEKREITLPDNVRYVNAITPAPDGSIIMEVYQNDKNSFYLADTENAVLNKLELSGIPKYPSNFSIGAGNYAFFVSDSQGIYGVQLNGLQGSAELVLHFVNSDFSGDTANYYPLPDGDFLFWEYAGFTDVDYYILRQRTEEEIAQMQYLSLAGVQLDFLKADICNFNRTHSDMRIMLKDYIQPDEVYPFEDANNRFQNDLLNGIVPDIICTNNLHFESLANKNLFEDLKPFMENDENFIESDYLMNYFDSMQYSGKQLQIGFGFSVTTTAAKTKYVGEKIGLTPSEFSEMLNNRPETMDVFQGGFRNDMMFMLERNTQDSFIDRESGTCHYDTPEFISLLELTKSLPEMKDTDEFNDEFWSAYWQDRALLSNVWINRPIGWHEQIAGYFRKEPITWIGYPTLDGGNGGLFGSSYQLAMYSESRKQQEIWNFFMEMLSEPVQNKLCQENGFNQDRLPVLRSSLEKVMTAATKGAMRTMYLGSEITTGNATEEEMQDFYAYIEGITKHFRYDVTIDNIISEEAEMYFADDQTAEKCAEMIQNRVSLYLSEQN